MEQLAVSPINTIVLLFVLIYGIAYGFKNWYVKIRGMVTGRNQYRQSDIGRILDAAFLVAISYIIYIFN